MCKPIFLKLYKPLFVVYGQMAIVPATCYICYISVSNHLSRFIIACIVLCSWTTMYIVIGKVLFLHSILQSTWPPRCQWRPRPLRLKPRSPTHTAVFTPFRSNFSRPTFTHTYVFSTEMNRKLLKCTKKSGKVQIPLRSDEAQMEFCYFNAQYIVLFCTRELRWRALFHEVRQLKSTPNQNKEKIIRGVFYKENMNEWQTFSTPRCTNKESLWGQMRSKLNFLTFRALGGGQN